MFVLVGGVGMRNVRVAVVIVVATLVGLGVATPAGAQSAPHRQMQPAAPGVNPKGPYTNWSWPQNGYYSDISERLTIKQGTSPDAHFFFAHQFAFQFGDGGYVGLQEGSAPNSTKIALFSIFSATAAQGANCGPFSNEGNGYTCRIDPFNWKIGRSYELDVKQSGTGSAGAWYTASVLDTVSGVRMTIGQIRVPNGWGGMQGWVSWTEDFGGPAAQCSDLPQSRVLWQYPTAVDGTVNVTGHSNTFGPGQCQTKVKDRTGGVLQIFPKFAAS